MLPENTIYDRKYMEKIDEHGNLASSSSVIKYKKMKEKNAAFSNIYFVKCTRTDTACGEGIGHQVISLECKFGQVPAVELNQSSHELAVIPDLLYELKQRDS